MASLLKKICLLDLIEKSPPASGTAAISAPLRRISIDPLKPVGMSALGQKQTFCDAGAMFALPPKADIVRDRVRIMKPVTIALMRAHGVRQLLVYCNGKREGDWPCHHHSELPIEQFSAEETLSEIQRRCRCTVCGWRRADLRPDYSRQQAALYGGGWMMPP